MRPIHTISFIPLLAAATACWPGVVRAGGDAAAGKARSLACEACHTSLGDKSSAPHLVAQRAGYLAHQLKAFKAGERKDPFMNAIATSLSDADIANLAAYWSALPVGADSTTSEAALAIKKSHIEFPRAFPAGFVLYLTANDAERNTVNRYYINAAGYDAAKANQPLPDGSVLIVSHASAKLGANKQPVSAKDGSWVVDKLDSYAAMEARAGWGNDIPELLRNDNWNYSLFNPDKSHNDSNQAVCLACHKPQQAVSYVFSFKELRAKAGAR
jgi:cytochrome c553